MELSVSVLFLSLRDFLGLLGLCGCVCVSLLLCCGGQCLLLLWLLTCLVCDGSGGVLCFIVFMCGLSGTLVCEHGVILWAGD